MTDTTINVERTGLFIAPSSRPAARDISRETEEHDDFGCA
jgi:hypothetical protein